MHVADPWTVRHTLGCVGTQGEHHSRPFSTVRTAIILAFEKLTVENRGLSTIYFIPGL